MTRLLTGLELNNHAARMVQIRREKQSWKLVRGVEIPFPPGTLDMSNRSENILDPAQFLAVLKRGLKSMTGKVNRIGLSVPSEIIKISIHTWDELPKSEEQIQKMIAWKERELLPFPVEQARTSFYPLNGIRPGKESLLVAMGSRQIIRDYEVHLRSLRLEPQVVQPSAISHLNFYSGHLPASGVFAFLSVLDDYFAFFVFEGQAMIFYRGKRKSSVPSRFLQECAMTIQLYQDENPGKPIETIFIQSQKNLPGSFRAEFGKECSFRLAALDESQIISPDASLGTEGKSINTALFASAIGAAQSLGGF